jgi:hypothetical protein
LKDGLTDSSYSFDASLLPDGGIHQSGGLRCSVPRTPGGVNVRKESLGSRWTPLLPAL